MRSGPIAGNNRRRLLADYEATREDLQVWEVDAGIDMGITQEFGVYHLPALFLVRGVKFYGRDEPPRKSGTNTIDVKNT